MVQVIGAILIFVFQNSLKTNVRTGLLKSLQLYGKEGDEGSTVFWDNIQKDVSQSFSFFILKALINRSTI